MRRGFEELHELLHLPVLQHLQVVDGAHRHLLSRPVLTAQDLDKGRRADLAFIQVIVSIANVAYRVSVDLDDHVMFAQLRGGGGVGHHPHD